MTKAVKEQKPTSEIFYIVLLVVLIFLAIKGPMAAAQNKEFLREQVQYDQGIQLLQKGDYAEAEKLLSVCVRRWPDNPNVVRTYALALAANKDYDGAEKYLRKAEDLRPAFLTDPTFLVQHAQVLTAVGKKADAKYYIMMARKYPMDQKLTQVADDLEKKLGPGSPAQPK